MSTPTSIALPPSEFPAPGAPFAILKPAHTPRGASRVRPVAISRCMTGASRSAGQPGTVTVHLFLEGPEEPQNRIVLTLNAAAALDLGKRLQDYAAWLTG